MSEFHFNYKCICMEDSDAKRNALKFYLTQDYVSSSTLMGILVYIPAYLQDNLERIDLYFQSEGVEPLYLEKTNIKPIQFDAKEIYLTNTITITNEKSISGSGMIVFIRKGESTPRPSDIYKFVTNYTQKRKIHYQIKEVGGKLKVEVIYPHLSKDIRLKLVYASKRRPLFENESDDEHTSFEKGTSIPHSIDLIANGSKSLNYIKPITFEVKTEGVDYRLAFYDKKDANSFILVDESEMTLEEIKDKDLIAKNVNKRLPRIKTKRCPFCNKELRIIPFGGSQTCQGRLIPSEYKSLSIFNNDKTTFICEEIYKMNPEVTGGPYIFPEEINKLPVMNVLFAGARQSGKTRLISSLYNLTGDYSSSSDDPYVLTSIVSHYDKKKNGGGVAKEYQINAITKVTEADGSISYNPYGKGRFYKDNRVRFLVKANNETESSTIDEKNDAISYYPVCFKMGNLGYTMFYDVPGEVFEREDNTYPHSFEMADSIIAIVDGKSKKEDNPLQLLLKCVKRLVDHSGGGKNSKIYDYPIAIVLSKLDAHIKGLADSKTRENELFDENNHITIQNVKEIMMKNKYYSGSELERHIDNSSREIVHYFKSFPGGDKVFREEISKFKSIKFFAVSALGSDEVLKMGRSANTVEVLRKPTPLRLELPIIWLMYQRHLIKR